MYDVTFLDNTIISAISKEVVAFNPAALNAIYNPNTQIVVTSTIYREAIKHHNLYADAAARKSWLDAGIASGNIIDVQTPEFPAGVTDTGELSMIHAANTFYAGQPVTFVSNDGFFDNFNAVNLQPNQRHYTGQEQILENLLEGGISAGEYFVTSKNLQLYSGEAALFTVGQTVLGTNGTIIDASNPLQIMVTESNGTTHTFDPFERFSIDHQGNVENWEFSSRAQTPLSRLIATASSRALRLRGKQPKLSDHQFRALRGMYDTGDYSVSDLAEVLSFLRPTKYRTLQ